MTELRRLETVRNRIAGSLENLWLVPGLIAGCFAGLAVLLVWIDGRTDLSASEWIFGGDASAARTVLSTIAGSLITIAGLTFSITIVVLQLASSQFSPRVLRTFMSDRITQVTAGTFIGIFTYCLLVLRAVRSSEEGVEAAEFIPSLSITVSIALALLALGLLLVFIHHIAQLIQVSHTAAVINRQTLGRLDTHYPDQFGVEVQLSGSDLVASWRRERSPLSVVADVSGFVQQVALDELAKDVGSGTDRVHIDVVPGEFVSLDRPLAFIWTNGDDRCEEAIRAAILVREERNIVQDVAFGTRQLTDIALRAISPGINDPTTAITCIGYLAGIISRLAARDFPSEVREFADPNVTVVARQRTFRQFLDSFAEIGRHADGDSRVVLAILDALGRTVDAAEAAGAQDRARAAIEIAEVVGNQCIIEAASERDAALVRDHLAGLQAGIETGSTIPG